MPQNHYTFNNFDEPTTDDQSFEQSKGKRIGDKNFELYFEIVIKSNTSRDVIS